jgi:hypothetical protein
MKYDQNQSSITEYFERTTRENLIISKLLSENRELREELVKKKLIDESQSSKLMHLLLKRIDDSIKSKTHAYDIQLKEASLNLFLLAGPAAYNLLQSNLPIPSIQTIRKFHSDGPSITEGEFQVSEIKKRMEERNEPLFLTIGEDDTKIVSGLKYDSKNDCVVGLELPLNSDGVPITSHFKFTTIEAVENYIKINAKVSYLKLLTATSMTPKSRPYILAIYGTRGSDKTKDVRIRWRYVINILRSFGIEVLGKLS